MVSKFQSDSSKEESDKNDFLVKESKRLAANNLFLSGRQKADQVYCNLNEECKRSTFCCSNYSCIDATICLHGLKGQDDTCDFGFECSSRCCISNKCSNPYQCYQKCTTN